MSSNQEILEILMDNPLRIAPILAATVEWLIEQINEREHLESALAAMTAERDEIAEAAHIKVKENIGLRDKLTTANQRIERLREAVDVLLSYAERHSSIGSEQQELRRIDAVRIGQAALEDQGQEGDL